METIANLFEKILISHFSLILPAAFLLDLILGDPLFFPHPIRWMGKAIIFFEPKFRSLSFCTRKPCTPFWLFISGALFSISLILMTWILTFIFVSAAYGIHSGLGMIVEIVLIYYCISVQSLESSAMDVYKSLRQNNLQEAKQKVSLIVGRDVKNLSDTGVARAAVETVAENLVDGVISPLFFASIGGAPLAMAYKMVNTLDSMIGYKNEAYEQFGKTAARTDDIANFIPSRLSVPVVSAAAQILAGKGIAAFKTAICEGRNHSSPNSGYSEAAFAGALGVKLGGPNYYHGKLLSKPYIGTHLGNVSIRHIRQACDLMMLSSILWCLLLMLFA